MYRLWCCDSDEPSAAGARVRMRELHQARAARAGGPHLPAVRRAAAQHRYVPPTGTAHRHRATTALLDLSITS